MDPKVWEDPLEKEMATHFQYSCLKNSMDRGAWWATVHGIAKELDMTERLSIHTLFFFLSKFHILACID